MSNHHRHHDRNQKPERHDYPSDHVFRIILHILERCIAAITILVLVVGLILQIVALFGVELTLLPTWLANFVDVNGYLHHVLTIIVGLEFVRMLIDTTPANILEVLTLAITRHVILSHDDYWSNAVSVACIAALFATRRYLVRRNELREELVEIE